MFNRDRPHFVEHAAIDDQAAPLPFAIVTSGAVLPLQLASFKMSSQVAKAARRVTHEMHGVVVSAGLMQKTVKVRVGGQKWNKIVNKVSHGYGHSCQIGTAC